MAPSSHPTHHIPMSPERLAEIVELLGESQQPATDVLLLALAGAVRDRREHDHPPGEDWFCANLSAYMGERAGAVLRRLTDSEAEVDRLRATLARVEAALAPRWDLQREAQRVVWDALEGGDGHD